MCSIVFVCVMHPVSVRLCRAPSVRSAFQARPRPEPSQALRSAFQAPNFVSMASESEDSAATASECDGVEDIAAMVLAAAEAPRQVIARACLREGASTNDVMNHVRDCEEEVLGTATPFGTIIEENVCSTGDGRPPWKHQSCNIKAFLYALCALNCDLEPFLHAHSTAEEDGRAVGRMVFYCDDVRPGNVLRPDDGRCYYAFYMAIADVPHWFTTGPHGWIDVAFVLKTDVDKLPAGLSNVSASLLSAINFPIDVDLPTAGGGHRPWRFHFAAFLSDEKAIKQVCYCKGAGSYKPCLCCANVIGRLPPASVDDPYFKHYSTIRATDFDQYSVDRWAAMCRHVEAVSAAGGAAAGQVAMECGMNFHPLALPFVDGGNLSRRLRLPETVYWDSMHSLWASGGIAQYQLNQFLRRVRGAGIPLKDLHGFLLIVNGPLVSRATFERFDLGKRVQDTSDHVNGNQKAIKAFSGECMDLMGRLLVLADMVLVPAGKLLDDVECLRLLHDIAHILGTGHEAVKHADLLSQNIERYVSLYLTLYGACMKPKLHFLRHLGGMIKKFLFNLSCFSMERHHRQSKTLASFLFKDPGSTILRRMTFLALKKLQDPAALCTNVIAHPWTRKRTRWTGLLRDLDPAMELLQCGRSMRTAHGVLEATQFWIWQSEACPTSYKGGVIHECWLARAGDGSTQPLLLVQEYVAGAAPTPSTVLFERRELRRLVHASRSLLTTFYVPIEDGARARVLIPRILEQRLIAR